MNKIKLKSCPFCGGKVHINENTEYPNFAERLADIYKVYPDCLRVPFKSVDAIYVLCNRHEPLRRKHTLTEFLAYMNREIIKSLIIAGKLNEKEKQ